MATESSDSAPSSPTKTIDSRGLGRRISSGLYYLVVTAIAIGSLIQITRQVYFSEASTGESPYGSCVDGLQALYEAVNRGRLAADKIGDEALANRNSEQALLSYRRVVNATWKYYGQVAQLCDQQPDLSQTLDALERLRYSEEHGVRYQAAELEPLRRRVRLLVAQSIDKRPSR